MTRPVLPCVLILTLLVGGTVAGALTQGAPAAAAQQPRRPLLRVRIIDGITAEPLAGVSVDVRCFDAYPDSTRFTVGGGTAQTNAEGEVVFDAREPGVCIILNTIKPGFSQRLNENTRPYTVGPGETLRVIRIWKAPAIKGRVLDERGRPLASLPVFLVAPQSQNPRGRPTTTTDADGRFSIEQLGASTPYALVVPTIALSQPTPTIELRAGESRDVELRGSRRPSFRVAGRVTDRAGSPQTATLSLDFADSSSSYPKTMTTERADVKGQFVFQDVPEGAYRIRIDTGGPGNTRLATESLWAEVSVTVGRNINDLAIVVDRMPEVKGVLTFDGPPPQPPGTVLLRFDALDGPGGRLMAGMIEVVDGQFRTAGLRPGRYVLRVALLPQGWRLQSAITNGRDISERPLEIAADNAAIGDLVVTFTEKKTHLAGTVTTTSGQVDREATVIAFTADRSLWADTSVVGRRVRQALTNSEGRYGFPDLPPGEYLLAAVATDDLPNQQQVPIDLLPHLASTATHVIVGYDGPVTQDLQRIR
jgi:protocatechuate 3,4-dioxygenase beta subunit